MKVAKIKVKDWLHTKKHGVLCFGRKLIIFTPEKQDFSIVEIEKITEFMENLRK